MAIGECSNVPFKTPTLTELANRSAGAFRSNLKGSDAALWPNNVAVSSKVMAGAVFEAFSFLEYISRQVHKTTAEGQFLERHAADYGLTRLPASFATGKVTLTGGPSINLPAGLVLQRADGVQYETTEDAATSGLGTVDVSVRALDVGSVANAAPNVQLAFVSPVDLMETSGFVASDGIGLGADAESDESLRSRLLFRLRNPPMGGAAHDYIIWVRSAINGVTRVFVDPVTSANGRDSVGLWFLMDDLYENGIPQSADVAGVVSHLDSVRPAGAIVEVNAPAPVTIDVEISGLSPDTTVMRDAIQLELAEMFRREMKVSTVTEPFTLYRSLISEAISNATGEYHHDLAAPASNQIVATGAVPVLGTVTFS